MNNQARYPWWDQLAARIIRFGLLFVPVRLSRTRIAVLNKGKILLVLNRCDVNGRLWTLPGGGRKLQETLQACAARELWEEVGIKVKADSLEYLGSQYKSIGLFRFDYRVFGIKLDSGNFNRNKLELLDIGWFELDDLPDNVDSLVVKAVTWYERPQKT